MDLNNIHPQINLIKKILKSLQQIVIWMPFRWTALALILVTLVNFCLTITSSPNDWQVDQQQLLQQQKKVNDQERKSNLYPWVYSQLQTKPEIDQQNFLESFIISLGAYQSYQFRWQLPSSMKQLQFKINVYTQQNGNDFAYIRQPAQDRFVEIEAKNDFMSDYQKRDKVYVTKTVTLPMSKQKFVKLNNLHSIPIMVDVSLLGKQFELDHQKVLKNDDFKLTTQKLQVIMDEVKSAETSRMKAYKWSWGFMQRQEHYQQQMLKLTAAELIVILGTAIVQIYCIKNLFDNELII